MKAFLLDLASKLLSVAFLRALLMRLILGALGAVAGFVAAKFGLTIPAEQLTGWANEISGALLLLAANEIAVWRKKWKLNAVAESEAAGDAAVKSSGDQSLSGSFKVEEK